MRLIFLAVVALLALPVAGQVKQNKFTTQNDAAVSAMLSPGVVYVDAVSGNDTNAGTISAPVATLTRGQELATNGGTVYAVRGTFAETVYPGTAAEFYLSRGVVLAGSGGVVFRVTNSASVLNVWGAAIFTNQVVMFDSVTGAVATICAKEVRGYPSSGIVYSYLGTSNRCYLAVEDTIAQKLLTVADEYGAHSYSNRFVSVWANAGKRFNANPYSTTGLTTATNATVYLTAPQYDMFANGGLNTGAKVIFNGGYFSRNGTTSTTVGSNIWFKGVSCVSSNTDAAAAIFSGVRGNFWFENERTAISNP